MMKKLEEILTLSILIGFIEWIILPIALGWQKNPFILPNLIVRIGLSIIAFLLPLIGYFRLKWEWKNN